jgi:PAS domain S-box-containing protein
MTKPAARHTDIKLSLQSRMIIYVVFLLSILMIVTTYMGIQRESRGIFEQMKTDGIALAKSYALSAENAFLLRAGLGRVTGEASRTRGIKYLKIIDKNRKILAHTDVNQIGLDDVDPLSRKALNTPITPVEQGKTPITLVDKSKSQDGIFRVIVPLVILDTVVGALEVGLDMTGISEAIQQTNTQSLIIALVVFLVGGLYIWLFARSLTRPIRNLVEAAERIAAGDLSRGIEVTSRDEIGQLASSFNYMTDSLREYTGNLKRINSQLEADAATIAELQSYTENILNSITPGVLTLDLAGKITTLNNAGIITLQLERSEVINKSIREVFQFQSSLRSFLEETIHSEHVYHGHEISVGTDAKEIWLILNTAFLYDQNAEVVGVAVSFDDVTEVRQLQKRIRDSEKLAAMGVLAVGIAHEVRNPLGAIMTSAQFLEAKFKPDDLQYRFTHLIIREVERLDHLVERLLNFTRPVEMDFQYEDLNEIIESVADLAVLKLTDHRLAIEKHYGAGIPRFFVDAKRLQQAFLNIMLNAIDAMPDGGQLVLKTSFEAENRWIKIEFSDTGKGIHPEQLDKIFNPFFTTRQRGTGLGLAIVNQIIAEHNGTIGVQSKVGEGTKFIITLPLCIEQNLMEQSGDLT